MKMIEKAIIDSDKFLDMPLSTQCLYFHIAIRTDDKDNVSNIKSIMRIANCKDDDLKILIEKGYIKPFINGVSKVLMRYADDKR